MATFPALRPAARRYSMGRFPITEERGYGGGSVRFLHGTTSSGHSLTLEYQSITQAEAKLLRDHYRGQQGGFLPFALSADAWAGHSSMTDLVPTTTKWTYASAPDEQHRDGGLVDVSLQLVSVV